MKCSRGVFDRYQRVVGGCSILGLPTSRIVRFQCLVSGAKSRNQSVRQEQQGHLLRRPCDVRQHCETPRHRTPHGPRSLLSSCVVYRRLALCSEVKYLDKWPFFVS